MFFTRLVACSAFFFICISCLSAQFTYAGSRGNLLSPGITPTEDGGALVLSWANCYTPGSLAFEGCSYARHLTRLDAAGDTLWTSEFSASTRENFRNVFENGDGGFTFFGSSASNYSCGNTLLGGLWGLGRLLIVRVDNQGEEINRFYSDNDCSYGYNDIIKLGEDRYAMTAGYNNGSDQGAELLIDELHYAIINSAGEIERQIIRDGSEVGTGSLLLNANNDLEFVYYDWRGYVREILDTTFTIISRDTSVNLTERPILNTEAFKSSKKKLASDGIFHLAVEHRYPGVDTLVTHYIRLGPNMEILSEVVLPLSRTTGLVEDANGDIWIGADKRTSGNSGVRLHKLDRTMGTIQEVIEIDLPEDHVVKDFNFDFSGPEVVLVGEYLCCSQQDSIYPREIFIYNKTSPISIEEEPEDTGRPFRVFPNPTSGLIRFTSTNLRSELIAYQIFDALGQLLLEGKTTNLVDLGGLPGGVYTYTLKSGSKLVQSGRIVKP